MRLGYKLRKHKRLVASVVAILLALILILGLAAPFMSW
jgi:energy-converting hydrogenase Eha subunit F